MPGGVAYVFSESLGHVLAIRELHPQLLETLGVQVWLGRKLQELVGCLGEDAACRAEAEEVAIQTIEGVAHSVGLGLDEEGVSGRAAIGT